MVALQVSHRPQVNGLVYYIIMATKLSFNFNFIQPCNEIMTMSTTMSVNVTTR